MDRRLKVRLLPSVLLILEVLRHVEREGRQLVLWKANEPAVEVRHGEPRPGPRDVLGVLAVDDLTPLAVRLFDPALDRQLDEVVHLDRPVRRLPDAEIAARLFERLVDPLLAHVDRGFLDAHRLEVAEVDLRRQRHRRLEDRGVQLLDGDLGDAAEVQVLVLDRLRRRLLDHTVQGLVQEVLAAEELLDDFAGGLALAKARDVQPPDRLTIGSVQVRLDVLLIEVHGQYCFAGGTSLGRNLHNPS